MEQLTFRVPHMDCPAEEQLVRMQLAECSVHHFAFDLTGRTVVITHTDESAEIARLMDALNLGATLVAHDQVTAIPTEANDDQQRKGLIIVLLINASLFGLELIMGLIAQSMGLIADSLDMLADAIVYGLSLYAVGKAIGHKQQIARLSGYFQFFLAFFGIAEVIRRFLGAGDAPSSGLMIGIATLALIGNAASLLVLQRAQRSDVHMQASWIFTTNDVLANLGVIVAGLLVLATQSKIPDLVVGAVVFGLVGYGALRIMRLSR